MKKFRSFYTYSIAFFVALTCLFSGASAAHATSSQPTVSYYEDCGPNSISFDSDSYETLWGYFRIKMWQINPVGSQKLVATYVHYTSSDKLVEQGRTRSDDNGNWYFTKAAWLTPWTEFSLCARIIEE